MGAGKSSKNPLSSNVPVSGTRLKKEMERMQDRCERLEALVAEVGRRQKADREERGCQPENSVFASIEVGIELSNDLFVVCAFCGRGGGSRAFAEERSWL